jgi:hypothetical protein
LEPDNAAAVFDSGIFLKSEYLQFFAFIRPNPTL